eukprot:3571883-Lingulodinium_polyedra.AAC.1
MAGGPASCGMRCGKSEGCAGRLSPTARAASPFRAGMAPRRSGTAQQPGRWPSSCALSCVPRARVRPCRAIAT